MTHDDARAVLDAWAGPALEANQYAQTFLALAAAMPEDDPDNLTAAVAALIRGLPAQWGDLAQVLIVTGDTLQARQAEMDRDFEAIAATMSADSTDVLDFLNQVTGLGPEDLDPDQAPGDASPEASAGPTEDAGPAEPPIRPHSGPAPSASESPHSPQIAAPEPPTASAVRQGPEPRQPQSEAWDALAVFLAETEPLHDFAGLLAILDELERLMVAVGLWDPGQLDTLAAEVLPEAWRAGTLTRKLKSFTTRTLIDATADLHNDPDGYTAAQRQGRETP